MPAKSKQIEQQQKEKPSGKQQPRKQQVQKKPSGKQVQKKPSGRQAQKKPSGKQQKKPSGKKVKKTPAVSPAAASKPDESSWRDYIVIAMLMDEWGDLKRWNDKFNVSSPTLRKCPVC